MGEKRRRSEEQNSVDHRREKFIWVKKIERDVITRGVPFSLKAEKKREKERMEEIEKVKKRREERAIEKARREEERIMLGRERAGAEFEDWEKEFDLNQSKIRSEMRLRQGRAKAIDVLTTLVNGSLDDFIEPYIVLKGLTAKEIMELRDEIKMHLEIDRATPIHIQYWEALVVVCDWELAQEEEKERGLHPSVVPDVKKLLEGKTLSELETLLVRIESDMSTGTAKVVEYWEAILKHLHMYKALACLNEIYAKMSRKNAHSINRDYPQLLHEQQKPKYFNRVHTGYEWNKYNRTHYDHQNPPPKTVQGYEFHVLYPDLVDKSKAPTYTLEKDDTNEDTCIIRFHAGPPYQDVAFRILNKEWEYSHKKGFKCTFQRGILNLHFNFKRLPYRT